MTAHGDYVLDDPGELVRFWLWHRSRLTVQGVSQTNLAKSLGVKSGTVYAWLDRHAIPTHYWNPIARFFERPSYRALEDEARVLWETPANRRGYTPLRQLQKKRRDLAEAAAAQPRELPATAELAGALRAASRVATRRRPPQTPARSVSARKSHGKRRGA